MGAFSLLLLGYAAAAASLRADAAEQPESAVLAAYVPDYRIDAFRPESADGVTDLILFSVQPRADGSVADANGLLRHVDAVKRLAAQHRWRILLCVGGGARFRSEAFPAVTSDPALRARLVSELVALAVHYQLDGIDVDWEHMRAGRDERALSTLIVELGRALSGRDLLLTAAVADPRVLEAEAVAALDRVHVMAYDGPRHGSFEQAAAAVEAALAAGVPAQKISLGIPLFARDRGTGAERSYADLIAAHDPPASADAADGYRFNGIETVRRKARHARERKLSGVFFWELTQDAGGESSLVRTAREALDGSRGSAGPR